MNLRDDSAADWSFERLREAGSFRAYVDAHVVAPRLDLLVLGRLCALRRAAPAPGCPQIIG